MFIYISQIIPPAETFSINVNDFVKNMVNGFIDNTVDPTETIDETPPEPEENDLPERLPKPEGLISFISDLPSMKWMRCPPGEDLIEDGSCAPYM